MIMVELKGGNLEHAFEQLAYMRNHRTEYNEIEQLFVAEQIGNIHHSAFIVSNFMISTVAQQKMEQENGIRVKKILHSEASKTIPDIRDLL
jgi:hypothetical protein